MKGTQYEIYIKNYLQNEENKKAWLWKDIPEYDLRIAGLLGDWNEHRHNRKILKNIDLNDNEQDIKENNLPDLGCDILMKDNEEYFIVQCKNFNQKNKVSVQHLAGFYATVIHSNLDGILYYTSDLSRNVITLLKINNNNKLQYIRKEFPDEEILKQQTEKQVQEKFITKPYYYQMEAFDKLKDEKRSILNLPCGMGKTLTSIIISQRYSNIIIISPLIEYSKQNLERFKNELDDYGTIMVNSEGIRNKFEILNSMQQNNKNIVSFTYDSVDVLMEIINEITDLIVIIDEFHNLSEADFIDRTTPMNKLLNYDVKILFMSATPQIFNTDKNYDELKFNKEKIFGTEIYSFPIARGIQEEFICDYEIYLPDIQVKNNIDDILNEVSLGTLSNESYLLSIKCKFILRGMLETGSKKCIIYLQRQKEAVEMVSLLQKINEYFSIDLYTDCIISERTANKRKEILDNFKTYEGFSIICSVSILDECIDIPECDSIFITYTSNSKRKNIQRLSRTNRKDKNNIFKISKIFLWCDEFQDITIFISHLKEFDESFCEEKVYIMNTEEKGGGILERNKTEKTNLYENLDNLIINVKYLGFATDRWKKNLLLLKEFIQENNKLPLFSNINQKSLSKWTTDQKYSYKKNLW
jgi:superfamily II DNA or RNA helicase